MEHVVAKVMDETRKGIVREVTVDTGLILGEEGAGMVVGSHHDPGVFDQGSSGSKVVVGVCEDFADYQATIEDYGVEFTAVLFQFVDLPDAIAQAAEHMNAQIVFAKIPESVIPFWTRFQRWSLNRQIACQKRQWIQYPVYGPEASTTVIEAASALSILTEHPAH